MVLWCLIFSKPTLTVSFGKYRLSIIFSLIYIIKIIFRSGNHPHNQWNRRSRVRHCLRVFCGLYLGYPTESTKAVNSSHGGYCLTRPKSRTAWEELKLMCVLDSQLQSFSRSVSKENITRSSCYFRAITNRLHIEMTGLIIDYHFRLVRDLPPPCCVLEQDTLLPESTG